MLAKNGRVRTVERVMSRFVFVLALLCGLLTSHATAQPAHQAQPDDRALIEACLANPEHLTTMRVCIGLVASPCLNSDDGFSTAGMMQCYGRERAVWLTVLNDAASQLRAMESPMQVQLLESALSLGEQWEQARCLYDQSIYEGGSLGRVVAMSCLLDSTALRAIDLRRRTNEYGEGGAPN